MVRTLLIASVAAALVSAAGAATSTRASGHGCISKWGRTVCGYDCKAKLGRIRCAQTPQGTCVVTHGVVRCWDPPKSTTTKRQPPQQRARCLSAHGKTVCGYGCKKAFGQLRCSQQIGGRCWKSHGRIACTEDSSRTPWRPPPPIARPPKGQCLSAYGTTRCGFNCVARYAQVKCAQTPQGVCKAAYSRIYCWDPPYVYKGMPKARCVTSRGRIACGYHCKARYGQAKCAATPHGACTAAYGRITCWDPERPSAATAPETAPAPKRR